MCVCLCWWLSGEDEGSIIKDECSMRSQNVCYILIVYVFLKCKIVKMYYQLTYISETTLEFLADFSGPPGPLLQFIPTVYWMHCYDPDSEPKQKIRNQHFTGIN